MTGRWTGKRVLVATAVALVALDLAFDAFSVAIYGWDGLTTIGVRLVLTVALAYFLATGRPWARWTIVSLCIAVLGTAMYALALVVPLQQTALVVMIALRGVVYSAVGVLLAFGPPVREYFRTTRGVSASQA